MFDRMIFLLLAIEILKHNDLNAKYIDTVVILIFYFSKTSRISNTYKMEPVIYSLKTIKNISIIVTLKLLSIKWGNYHSIKCDS